MARIWYIFRTSRRWRYDTTGAVPPSRRERYSSLHLGEDEAGAEMPFRRVLPALRSTTAPPYRCGSFRTTLSDSAVPNPHPLYGETDDYDDIDSALAFDDDMCVTIEQCPFQHGTNRILTISNACLAAESDVLPTSPTSEVPPTTTHTATSPKRRLSTKLSSVFSSSSLRQKPPKRPRMQESRSSYAAEVIYDPSTDFFIISPTSTSKIRTYSPSDVRANGRRMRAQSSPSAASRRVLQAAMRPIAAMKRRCGAAMGTRRSDLAREKGSLGLGMGLGKGRGTKCVVVGT
ncbi:hypothetical protein QBC34DRAFT_404841 [Podospora aff. communis PSN243]|uniref:Uncharacterized protein n=1 Tax=Podospora aff. communis PSN243 TaxID=3040156 RepID=A0AAV9GPR8_9PEZI|nr:hypothetical protein QBC34DRAFT_404841 [Podospora aff. communis PSN243]